jgi:arsenate reductase
LFTELGLAQASDEALIDAMVAHPILMNRPVVVKDTVARLCRPQELVLALLPA